MVRPQQPESRQATSLRRSTARHFQNPGDFESIIARFAPGSVIYLTTLRDGELFDRTITLGYAHCPSGLSASNLPASQTADAFPSLKKRHNCSMPDS